MRSDKHFLTVALAMIGVLGLAGKGNNRERDRRSPDLVLEKKAAAEERRKKKAAKRLKGRV